MDREMALAKLRAVPTGDSEAAHLEADRILLDFLRTNGFADIAKAWERKEDAVGFWYA